MYLDRIWLACPAPREVRGEASLDDGVASAEDRQGRSSACRAGTRQRMCGGVRCQRGIALLGDGAMCRASERMRALGLGPRVNLGDDEQLA
jgi:hypothetical protein